jgi:DNA (cytosine-5)-methyltransferase 1
MKNFVEFFAGVGLVREGLQQDNWECLFANDISQDKQDTYIKNFGATDFHLGDIWGLVDQSSIVPDDAFLYTASFPCTDLSVAGNRVGLAGVHSGTLNALFEILDKKEEQNCKPKMVLLENVKGFLTSNNGEDLISTIRLFTELGYFVDIIELDAAYFTPQSRQRVFIIAVEQQLAVNVMLLKDPDAVLDSWWAAFDQYPMLRSKKLKKVIQQSSDLNWGLFEFNFNHQINNRLSEVIEIDMPADSNLWWNEERQKHLFEQMNEAHKTKLIDSLDNDFLSYGTVYRRMRNGKSRAEYRTDGIAGCLRTPKGGSSKQILIQAGYGSWKVRLLTPREYARLRGVRDDFILPDNINKGLFAMGDAVCVPVIQFLSENILSRVYEYWRLELADLQDN